jgi:hypothetical protein
MELTVLWQASSQNSLTLPTLLWEASRANKSQFWLASYLESLSALDKCLGCWGLKPPADATQLQQQPQVLWHDGVGLAVVVISRISIGHISASAASVSGASGVSRQNLVQPSVPLWPQRQ